jgi:hypothetical protein
MFYEIVDLASDKIIFDSLSHTAALALWQRLGNSSDYVIVEAIKEGYHE